MFSSPLLWWSFWLTLPASQAHNTENCLTTYDQLTATDNVHLSAYSLDRLRQVEVNCRLRLLSYVSIPSTYGFANCLKQQQQQHLAYLRLCRMCCSHCCRICAVQMCVGWCSSCTSFLRCSTQLAAAAAVICSCSQISPCRSALHNKWLASWDFTLPAVTLTWCVTQDLLSLQ